MKSSRWAGIALVLLATFGGTAACKRAPDNSVAAEQEPPKTTQKPPVPVRDPLPSWNDGPSKRAIVEFVTQVTNPSDASFVPPEKRIATFDNDGTLWSEKPVYFELTFAFDRIVALAPQHPEWRTKQPFKAVLENDPKALLATGEKGVTEIVMVTHSGMTSEEFARIVDEWLATAKHPRFNRPYTELVYQPMLELLKYLRDSGFKTFIVSGGGVEFMRAFTERVYGVPPEQVVGSAGVLKYELRGETPVLVKLPKVDFVDDGDGKPVGIERFMGRRPVFAFGNSDGDFQMLQWTTRSKGKRYGGIVHHTDAEREWAYDRKSEIGRLDKALDAAPREHWNVVDMKNDWKVIYPFELPGAPVPAPSR